MGDADDVAAILRERDEAGFLRLYRAHTPALYRVAMRLLGARSEAEDAVQETWLRAVTRLADFRGQSALRTWLTGITINCCREAWRRRTAGNGRAAPSETGAADDPADALDLARALQRMPEGYREVLVLHDVEGFTHQEIGSLLGVAPGTSKSQLFSARRAMRRLLPDAQGDEGHE
jgi:RNA polymerase sigma-70 factor (ECF subfamily)